MPKVVVTADRLWGAETLGGGDAFGDFGGRFPLMRSRSLRTVLYCHRKVGEAVTVLETLGSDSLNALPCLT